MFRTFLQLGRVSNLPTVWTNLTAAWLLGGGSLIEARLGGLLLGGSLLYLAGMALNDAAGAPFDRQHKQERPIPQGLVRERTVWIFGSTCLASGSLALSFAGAPLLFVAAIVALILGYTFTHKRWKGCILLMGGIRACLYLIGGASALRLDPHFASDQLFLIHPIITIWASAVGLYTVLLTRTARCEYPDSQGKPTLPPALFFIPVAATLATCLLLPELTAQTIVFFLLILVSYLLWLGWVRTDLRTGKTGFAVGKLLAGIALIDALAVSATHPYFALPFLALPPFLLLWQKVVPAT